MLSKDNITLLESSESSESVPVYAWFSQQSSRSLPTLLKSHCLYFFCFMSATGSIHADIWTKTSWKNEPAWISTQNSVTAVVSESRGRLVYFGSDTQGLASNLIFVPPSGKDITGSHAVWLGPQSFWGWPPSKDWDSPAVKVELTGDRLSLTEPSTDARFPQLVRSYKRDAGKLICGVSWTGTDKPFYAMQIIQVPASAQCSLNLIKSPTLPAGAVLVEDNVRANPAFVMPTHGVKLSADAGSFVIAPEEPAIKVGVPPQPIMAHEGNDTLTIARGTVVGDIHEGPDFGCFTQIWTGSPALGYFEAEQFSPVLTPPKDGAAFFSIILEAGPSKPTSP